MKITVITVFPEFFESPLEVSIVRRAVERQLVEISLLDLRSFATGGYRQVDDTPFGGGAGMVMMVEPMARALDTVADSHRVLFGPAGHVMAQEDLARWSEVEHLCLVCGRYEGVDQRVSDHLVDEEVSLGDFVMAGGEVAALAVIEGVVRLLPGVLGNPESLGVESFSDGLLEEPQYTRPAEFRGWKVPDVLLSGDHARIEDWRRQQRTERTRRLRPDLDSQ